MSLSKEATVRYIPSQKSTNMLYIGGFAYQRATRKLKKNLSIYWRCKERGLKCPASCTTYEDGTFTFNGK